ncbi:hypothetical protein LCGC14_1591310 [marine sediment metagenome]|uniref:Uncharacterized protein n=2 Tax=marine sediment metagenome TaxID=412755 RepID=A0A0F9J059_9ZZZZ
MLSEEYTEIVGDIFIGGEWQTHDLQPKIVALEEQLKIEKQKHLDTANWALEQQERADTLDTKFKEAEDKVETLDMSLTSFEEHHVAHTEDLNQELKDAEAEIETMKAFMFGAGVYDAYSDWKAKQALKEHAEDGE